LGNWDGVAGTRKSKAVYKKRPAADAEAREHQKCRGGRTPRRERSSD
jgi:hypothetical protein